MNLYSETDLDNDIRYVKSIFTNYNEKFREMEENVTELNKTVTGRLGFISSQFNNIFLNNRMW